MSRKSVHTALVAALLSIFAAASLGAAIPVSANGTPVVTLEGDGSIMTPSVPGAGTYGNSGVMVSPNGEFLYAQTGGEIWKVDLSTALGIRLVTNGQPGLSVTNADGTKAYVVSESYPNRYLNTLDLVAGTVSPNPLYLQYINDVNAITSGVVATKEVVYAYDSSQRIVAAIDMASGVITQTQLLTSIPNGVRSLAVSAEGSKLYAANATEIWAFSTADMSIPPVKLDVIGAPLTGGFVMKVHDDDITSSTNLGRIYILDALGNFKIIEASTGGIWAGTTLGSEPRAMDIRSNGDAAFGFRSNVVSYFDYSAAVLITEEFQLVGNSLNAYSVGIVFDENITHGTCIYTSNNGDSSLSAVGIDGADCGPFRNRLGQLPALIQVNNNAVMTVSAPTSSSREEQWVGIGIFVDGVLNRVVKPEILNSAFASSIDLVWKELSGLIVTVRTYNQAHLDSANLTRVDDVTFTTSFRHERSTALDYFGFEAGQVAAGSYHSCALADGSVYCWGENEAGQLGDGTLIDRTVATKVLATGEFTNIAVTSIDVGSEHTCAIESGKAYCWGSNYYSQLGSNTSNVTEVSRPTKVANSSDGFENEGISAISAGRNHSCAVTDGSVYCWGRNSNGQIGNGTTNTAATPTIVSNVASVFINTGVSQVSSGNDHTCVVSLGSVYCWGSGSNGRLGNNSTVEAITAVKVLDVDGVFANANVTAIAAGGEHTCAITGGSVFCWGYGDEGQIGNDDDSDQRTPVKVANGSTGFINSSVTHLTAGDLHNCAVQGGSVYCWGYGDSGQLGDDNNNNRDTPVKVYDVTGIFANTGIMAIAAGEEHSCAVSSGDAFCWGEGSYYRLGHGLTTDSEVAVKVCCGVASEPEPTPTVSPTSEQTPTPTVSSTPEPKTVPATEPTPTLNSSILLVSPLPSPEASEAVAPTTQPSVSPSPEAVIESQGNTEASTYSAWLWWLLVVLIPIGLYLWLFALRRKQGNPETKTSL